MSQRTAIDPLAGGLFKLAGLLTRWSPGRGARALDRVLYPLLGSRFLVEASLSRQRRRAARIPSYGRILVVSDIHIGDAVLVQTAVSALRDFFPESRIDYMVKRSAACLLEGHPDVSELWPAFNGGRLPDAADLQSVRELCFEYDAVFNFSPFIPPETFPEPRRTFHVTARSPLFVRNEREGRDINHVSYQAHRFIYDLFEPLGKPHRERSFEGPQVFLGEAAQREARDFLGEDPDPSWPKVLLNLDTASPYTRIPERYLDELAAGLLRRPLRIYLGEGHADPEAASRLLDRLPSEARGRFKRVPRDLPLDAYAALLDHFDVVVSGDTGPLHLAAAVKRPKPGARPFRNRTTVLGVFGATPPRFSGYDSRKKGFLPSPQAAGSRSFQSKSTCRNITCIHKIVKTCDATGCFQGLDVDGILNGIRWGLRESGGRKGTVPA